jgi:Protein of unknown function (DUF3769)
MPYPVLLAEILKSPEPIQQPVSPALSTPFPPSIPPIDPPLPTPVRPQLAVPQPNDNSPKLPAPIAPLQQNGVIELQADQQTYDQNRQIFTAEGKVVMRFRDSVLKADRLQVNLINRFAVAEGNVFLTKGAQVLQGDRFEYNFVQGQGRIQGARGEIGTQSAEQDFSGPPPVLPSDVSATAQIGRPVSEQIYRNQAPTDTTTRIASELTIGNTFGQGNTQGLGYRRVRFEAGEADFFPDGWIAKDIRITNDPFSPPELEIRARTATAKKISATEDEVLLEKPQLVFDQKLKLPIPRNRIVLNGKESNPWIIYPGYDSGDRGGLYFERSFNVITAPGLYLAITPEVYVQRAFSDSKISEWFGVKAQLSASLGRAQLYSTAELTSLDLSQFEQRFRGNLQLAQPIGTHTLALQGAYRTRLFNNSLGFQDVQSTIGGVFYSPIVPLWNTGINLSYQAGYQYINADTDRLSLLNPIRTNNRVNLHRYQASAALSKGFRLWQGKPLPATQNEGLRYTPTPVIPYFDFTVGTTGVMTGYSSGDIQNNLTFSAGINAQLGHFSKPAFDYTALNITYSQALRDGSSPFLFDRVVDSKVLFAGVTQQIYGPWRAGFQTAWNIVDSKEFSTDYFIEYSRRTYNVRLRYNPVLSLGSLSLTVSDFNWSGGSQPFDATGVTPVNSGVIRP